MGVSNPRELMKRGNVADEAELIRRLKQGDEEAFRRLVTRHQKDVYRMARSLVKDHDDADEVAQRTFINVYRKMSTFQGKSSLRTWIYRIAINQAKNLLRQRARRVTLPETEHLADHSPLADEQLERKSRWQRVTRAVEDLPRLQKEVLTLRASQGLAYEEIARIVGCSAGSAKVNYHHAVKKLRTMLAEGAL